MKSKPQSGAGGSSGERFLTPKKRKKRRRVIVGSRSRRARQRLNRKAKQSSSTESSSEGEGAEEGEESTAMETSQSEGETHVIDVITTEQPVTETIGQRLRVRSRSGSNSEPSTVSVAKKREWPETSEASQEEEEEGGVGGEGLLPEAKRLAQGTLSVGQLRWVRGDHNYGKMVLQVITFTTPLPH